MTQFTLLATVIDLFYSSSCLLKLFSDLCFLLSYIQNAMFTFQACCRI